MATQPWPPVPTNTTEWYKQAWFTILTLFLCFPIGLFLMWMYQKKWHILVKSLISGLIVAGIIGSATSTSSPSGEPAQPTSPITAPLTTAQKQQAAKAEKKQAVEAKASAEHQKEVDAKVAAQEARQEAEDERKKAEASRQQEAEQRRLDEFNESHYQNDGLTFDKRTLHWDEDDAGFASYITGKVTNDSGADVDYAEITFKELDGEGNQVGTAQDNITHLAAGATWKFKCGVLEDSTKRIQLDELKTTPF